DPSVSYSDDKVCFCHPMIALKNLDPSVTHWDDTLLDRNQCLGTGMTPKGLLLFWMETSVSYFHDTLTSSSRYVLAAKRYRGGMTVRGGIAIRHPAAC
ncbi:hypothetical protein H9I48_05285, partial [Wolbachia pipientis]|nr:hypothetical protein [Wolbachia pipientis]